MSKEKKALFIIFGGTGDLARRKLYPSLYRLYKKGYLNEHFAVIGTARREWSDEHYQDIVKETIEDIQESAQDAEEFASHFRYLAHNVTHTEHYDQLKELSDVLDEEYQLDGNRLFYLAMSPHFFGLIAEHIKSQNLKTEHGFSRLIIEKPFGEDYPTAKELNNHIRQSFDENEIFRIDHYLGKEMVQSLLTARFANQFIKNIWNKQFIDNIQITLSEKLGVEERGGYYDNAGALKDMVQNHALQLVSLLSMDQPESYKAEDIRAKKVEALASLNRLSKEDVKETFVRGQYDQSADGRLCAYRIEDQIDPQSETETFVAGKLTFNTERWTNVPFYIRTGKRMPSKTARVDIVMRNDETLLFDEESNLDPVVFTLHLDPKQGWTMQWNNKKIGPGLPVQKETLAHFLPEEVAADMPEAYEKLLLDSLNGDPTNFAHSDEVAEAWKYIDPIRQAWDKESPTFPNYKSGEIGPLASIQLLEKDNRKWIWSPHF